MKPTYHKAATRWSHFALMGRVVSARSLMNFLVIAPTLTDEAKRIAAQIQPLLEQLEEDLRRNYPK